MKRSIAVWIMLAAVVMLLAGCQDDQRVRDALIDMGYMGATPDPEESPTPAPQPTPGPTPRVVAIGEVAEIGEEPAEAASVSLSKSALSLKVGKSARLKATVLPKTASDKSVSFTSDNPLICTVGPKGKVRAIAPGTAIVTCATKNGLTAQCLVTVREE